MNDPEITSSLTGIFLKFLEIYTEPWFLVSIIFTFFIGQFIHVMMRGYANNSRDLTKGLVIWTAQFVVGFICTKGFVEHAFVDKYAWLTGIHSIALYYGLYWVSTKWFKWPLVAQWLTLRRATLNEKNEIEFGPTISFITGKKEGKL